MKQANKAMEEIKAVYEDGFVEINGTEYHFSKMKHHERLKVFELLQNSTNQLTGEMKIQWTSQEFKEVEKLVNSKVLVDDMQISKINDYWDEHLDDYMAFMMTALQVICFPFIRGRFGM